MSETNRVDAVEHIEDHDTSGLALFYRQFANTPNIRALASAWLTQVQAIEDALWDLLVNTLENATDAALDQVGGLLGLGRGELDDDSYRAVLFALVVARRSSGGPEDLMLVARTALDAITFRYREGHASACITPQSVFAFAPALLFVLKIAKSAGVQIQLRYLTATPTHTFTFSGALLKGTSSTAGFADTTQTSGGHLAGVIA